jgi:transcriptional regulator with XRE-family HTH domain
MGVLQEAIERGALSRIAEATGCTRGHVKRVLDGERIPSLELARAIAAYLGERTPASVLAVLVPVPAGVAAADSERVLVPGVDVPEEGEAAV